ncbi:hypothetical protein T265_08576 [Opisthorchis viverrini]|uniref:Uncharacterized protein n=1 Tax=Opisthorchis viverrini TaxID=6198 RepID=A0A074Z8P9_OPIVI|nr:hypothetical protein T265_08576 [Opisthorchis viverrini]KER23586.1 hypothetical protein T265_08576 [Opisthorchis viverrini]
MPVAHPQRVRISRKLLLPTVYIYMKRCTSVPDFVWGVNRPCTPLVVVLTTRMFLFNFLVSLRSIVVLMAFGGELRTATEFSGLSSVAELEAEGKT